MPILSGDIKLLSAERLLDTPDGGGRMTGHVVVDGQANNLFPDISELDRTYGRVSLRKCYPAVLTDSTDSYYGAHAVLSDGPDDPNVSVTLFTTKSWVDRRDAAKDRIERYLARGPKWPGQLLERQLTGQRAITLLLHLADPLPRIGQALVLVQDEMKPTEVEQYVRITRISTTEREFTVVDNGQTLKFKGVVATCEISDPLRHDFDGPPPTSRDDLSAKAIARDTVVANAAVYYGIAPTVADAHIGDLRVQVGSLFGQLVPSAQSETPLVDLSAAGQMAPLVESGTGAVSFATAARIGASLQLYLGNGCVPGSLSIRVSGAEITDAGGELKTGTTVIGTIDYARGILSFASSSPIYDGSKTVSFRPAAAPLRVSDTAAIAITQENRGYAYTLTLTPPPKPGALLVSYMAQGKWYDLRDRGDGALRGSDTAFGAGTVDYASGSVIVTTGALPDANTEMLFAWGTAASYFNRVATAVPAPSLRYTVTHPGIVPGTLGISWTDGTTNRQAVDNGHGGISGDATGSVRYAQGELIFTPSLLPAGGAEYHLSYQYGPPLEASFSHPIRNADGTVTVRLPQADLLPGSVELEYNLLVQDYVAVISTTVEWNPPPQPNPRDPTMIARDVPAAGAHPVNGSFNGGVSGTVNYAAGEIIFNPEVTVSVPRPIYTKKLLGESRQAVGIGGIQVIKTWRTLFERWEYIPAGANMPYDETGYVKVRYRAQDSANSAQEILSSTGLELDLTDHYNERIVPGSVRFALGQKVYIDRLGTLVTDIDAANGAGTLAGSLDYASGKVRLSVWQPGAGNSVVMQSLLTELGGQPVDEATFRVPAAPVRPGSVQIRATALAGGQINASANADGTISTTAMSGLVDYQTGIVRVRFGHWVTAAGNEVQPWFDVAAVMDGKIFQPLPVNADTIRFNAVAYSYLPLSSDVLGLDPVRLPMDGKVPIYRPGDVAVVHHTASTPFPIPAVAGFTLNVGRVRLTSLRILDADGKVLPAERYLADLDNGTVTLNTPLNLAGFREPLQAEHRVEDMGLISDTQINGVLTLTRALTHDFPANQSKVSSALIIGDLQARAHTLFAQQTWTGEWSDNRIGANTTAQYNATVYPLVVTNRGAIEERWALIFESATQFAVVGESVGRIAVGNTTTDVAPANPETGAPYFRLQALGWGSGWSAGNVLRFATAAANFPVWVARTVLQGVATRESDSFSIQIRGDIDR